MRPVSVLIPAILALGLLAGPSPAQTDPVLPAGFDSQAGGRPNAIPFGSAPLRYQQVFEAGDLPAPTLSVSGLAVRAHGGASAPGGTHVELEVFMTTTPRAFNSMSREFDENYGAPPTLVFSRKHLLLPPFQAQQGPTPFHLQIHFDRPFFYAAPLGNPLVEVRIHGNDNDNRAVAYPLDAVWDGREPIPARTTRIYSASGPGDPSGTLGRGYGLVWQFLTSSPATVYPYGTGCSSSAGRPVIASSDAPALGGSFAISLDSAPAGTPVVLWMGAGRDRLGASPLPLDLTPHGAPGCSLLLAPSHFLGATTSGAGEASIPFQVPNFQELAGGRFFLQWLIQDGAANPLGLVATKGLEATIR